MKHVRFELIFVEFHLLLPAPLGPINAVTEAVVIDTVMLLSRHLSYSGELSEIKYDVLQVLIFILDLFIFWIFC
jgi:hypothetical protein